MILIELTAAVNAAGALQTFYVADGRFVTGPADTPPNTAFEPCVLDPGSIGLHAFSDGRTGGATRLETGEIVLANVDGQFDAWLNYAFDGRPVVIRAGDGGAYPAAFSTVMVGTVESVEANWKTVVLRLKDKQWKLQLPARTVLYGGSNVLPDGLDGLPGDLAGKPRPVAYGKVFNVSAPLVNTSRYIFEVGVCQSVDAVYSNGVQLTAGTPYASQADMMANGPGAGVYRAWPAGGYFRLGSFAAEQVTADVTQGAAASDRSVAQILRRLALDAGLAAGDISAGDVAALDGLNPAVVGIWLDDAGGTYADAMDQIAASIGAWYGFDAAGVLRMGRLSAPGVAPAATLRAYDCLEGLERRPARDNGLPVWSVTVNHTRNWTVQNSGLAGSAAARRGFVEQERRAANAADASVRTQWLHAGTLAVDTLLTSAADAAAEAARLLALQKSLRGVFDVPVPLAVLAGSSLRMMDTVTLQLPRFGMDGGRNFRLIGIALNLANGTATLSLWG